MAGHVETLEGYYSLHFFYKLDWNKLKCLPETKIDTLTKELQTFLKLGNTKLFSIIGHKADILFIHFRNNLEELHEVEREFKKLEFYEYCTEAHSFFSIVELSSYVTALEQDPFANPMIRKRLFPELPPMKHVCFYPMNKKRQANDNWYMTPKEKRSELMSSHGTTGRNYAGKIVQIVTGAIGLDLWEWGVTLFSDDPLQFKKIVTEMRFDEVSARFGEFGEFYIGTVINDTDIKKYLSLK